MNSFTTHADAVRIKVHIGYTEAGQKGTTYFDDVYLAEGTVPTTKIPAVQNIALDATTNTLTWKAPTTGNPVDYRIYMGTTPSFAITPNLLLWHTTETTFTETNIDNTAGKYFAVVPVGEGGFEKIPAYFPSNGAGLKKVVNNTTRISPNPAVDEITIEANDNQCNIISIYDILGKKVLEIPLKANSTIVNISELSKGNYIVKVGNEFHKLIKK